MKGLVKIILGMIIFMIGSGLLVNFAASYFIEVLKNTDVLPVIIMFTFTLIGGLMMGYGMKEVTDI